MNAQAPRDTSARRFALDAAPVAVILLAAIGARTALAAAYPTAALLLFLWIASDTMILALVARTPGRRPRWHAVLGTAAAASLIVWLGSPAPLRTALLATPAIAAVMASAVLGHVAWATLRARRTIRSSGMSMRDRWTTAAAEFLPPAFVRLAAAELSVIHIALFRWGGPADIPAGSRTFAYHRHLAPMCATLLVLSLIEIAVCHLLAAHWSPTAALILFALSVFGLVYLIGLIKSFRYRPVLITAQGVRIRAGLAIDQSIPLERIARVETAIAGADIRDPATLNAALLAWPNILLRIDPPIARRSWLGRRAPIAAVAFRLDDPDPFVRLLNWRLGRA
jgi:hypothetical protein